MALIDLVWLGRVCGLNGSQNKPIRSNHELAFGIFPPLEAFGFAAIADLIWEMPVEDRST